MTGVKKELCGGDMTKGWVSLKSRGIAISTFLVFCPSRADQGARRERDASETGALRRLHHRGVLWEGGWGAALAHHFSRKADVVLRGYSGYNTRWALKVVGRAMEGVCPDGVAPPAAAIVFFGANDASLPDRYCSFQHVPLPEYQSNLRGICAYLRERWSSTVIILITPPAIDEDGRLRDTCGDNSSGLPERTNESAGAYAKACVAVADELGLPVIDIWSKMLQFPDWEKSFLRDGLHFTASGNSVLFEEVVKKLGDEGLSLEALPVDLPQFRDMDPNDPLKSLRD